MGLISKTIKIRWNVKTKKHYESKGYKFTKYKDEFEIKVEDLSNGSHVLVDVKCDCKDCENSYFKIRWKSYKKYVHKDGKYYCDKCSKKNIGEKVRLGHLKNSKSFKQWCIENDRQDVLNRWDYELNKCKPNEINYCTNKKYYFKCSRKLHLSELKQIGSLTRSIKSNWNCTECNSFAQWGINNIDKDFLDKYWDYEKNDKLGLNPWKISKGSGRKVWIKCQKKDYHDSYDVKCVEFVYGVRCPYCGNFKVHPRDSLGQYIIDNYGEEFLNKIWSSKNKKSPFEYAIHSEQKVWFKCLNENHIDYYRNICSAVIFKFKCPSCQYSKGEKRIEKYLIDNNFIKNVNYIPQMKFNDLLGIGNGNLSYDFYLPEINLLIEYQGIQHEKPVDFGNKGIEKAKENFIIQQEHDKRKKEYANNHNIKLIPIWYWDYNNIENILHDQLNNY